MIGPPSRETEQTVPCSASLQFGGNPNIERRKNRALAARRRTGRTGMVFSTILGRDCQECEEQAESRARQATDSTDTCGI